MVPAPRLLPTAPAGVLGPVLGAHEGLLRKQGCCQACGHHESPVSLLSRAIKRRKGAVVSRASRTQGAIRPRARLPAGILWHFSNHLVEINCDFPGDSCQQQQEECCTLSPARQWGRRGCTRVKTQDTGPAICNNSTSPESFSLSVLMHRPHLPLIPHPMRPLKTTSLRAPMAFPDSRFTASDYKPKSVQGLLPRDP